MKITGIIKRTEYDLSLFSEKKIQKLENNLVERHTKKGLELYFGIFLFNIRKIIV